MVIYEPGDVVYYPHPMRRQKTKKTMKVIDTWSKYYPSSGKWYIRYLYDGLMDCLVQEMHENVEKDLDNVICIWGAEGSGKSVLAYWLAKTYDPGFDMEEGYVYSFDDLLARVNESNGADTGRVFWLDEATNISNNRDWMRQDNKAFITMLEMFRSRKWTLIMCIPSFYRLDVYLRENRVRYALHAQILEWDSTKREQRGYFELTRISVNNGYRSEDKVGYGFFPDIPDEDREAYAKIKKGTQDDKLREMYEKKNGEDRNRQGYVIQDLILEKKERGETVAEIAAQTGYSEQTVMNLCTKARKRRKMNGGDDDDRVKGNNEEICILVVRNLDVHRSKHRLHDDPGVSGDDGSYRGDRNPLRFIGHRLLGHRLLLRENHQRNETIGGLDMGIRASLGKFSDDLRDKMDTARFQGEAMAVQKF